jgi:predicted GIY-YIG superfamily endonuclease
MQFLRIEVVKINYKEFKKEFPVDASLNELQQYFKTLEKVLKYKMRNINNFKEIEEYFVDGPNNIRSKYNIYKFLNKEGEIIYIGQTSNYKNRLNTHLSKNGHLPKGCYDELEQVLIAPCNNRDEMLIYERYLINLLEPKYNNKLNNNNNFRFKLPELNWFKYEDYKL